MRSLIVFPFTAAFVAAAVLASTPAGATTLSQATKLCQKNPNCHPIGEQTFCVDTRKEVCANVISCPSHGNCTTRPWASLQPGAGRKPPSGNIGTAMTGRGSKPIGGEGSGATTATGGAPNAVRDHRTGPVVRDHRVEAVVQDYRTDPAVRDHRTDPVVHDNRDHGMRAGGGSRH